METNKLVIIFLLLIILIGCKTTAVIIEPVPEINMQDNVSLEGYLKETADYSLSLKTYIRELINQIKHKVPYVDVSEELKKDEKE